MRYIFGIRIGLILFCSIIMEVKGQEKPILHSPVGEYYLEGVMETASGIRINADSSFQFFFSYGASDREGNGRWSLRHNTLVLSSRPRPEKDFRLITSKKIPGDRLIIAIKDPNTMILSFVQVMINGDESAGILHTDSRGRAETKFRPVNEIALVFGLCADRLSTHRNPNPDHNYFEFAFEPWICEVFFPDLEYEYKDGSLYGPHPLLKPGKYTFAGTTANRNE